VIPSSDVTEKLPYKSANLTERILPNSAAIDFRPFPPRPVTISLIYDNTRVQRRSFVRLCCLGLNPSDEMICWPMSARVGNVKNNDPSLVEPIAGVA
jgi:hypothetical protein